MKPTSPILRTISLVTLSAMMLALIPSVDAAGADASDTPVTPPQEPVRLIFIHHSTGGNWLADPNPDQPGGGLGRTLMENNYFVSATNYGWGPDSIGDRTDIIDWPEWFAGPNRDEIMQAVYTESDQNIGDFGDWPRLPQSPGGENQIIVFKSCFPNSDLWGNPNDPPLASPTDEYTVANAKAVYNALLNYFQTRQDKLFIVITAPPLAQGEYYDDAQSPAQRAANARAFNNWLVNDWLADYPYANVAVFDYYNVLTSNGSSSRVDDPGTDQEPNDIDRDDGNHHRWWDGEVQHIQTVNNDFSAYPSDSYGDSHPTSQGHQKATDEFVTLLNYYYNRWQASEPPTSPPSDGGGTGAGSLNQGDTSQTGSLVAGPVIDDMEGEDRWDSYPDGQGSSVVSALTDQEAHSGTHSLQVEVDIIDGGWGDTGLYFESAQDWGDSDGLVFWLHASQAGIPFSIVIFTGDPESPGPFVLELTTSPDSSSGWASYAFNWSELARASWADPTGPESFDPSRISGMSFNFLPGQVTLWVDDLGLLNYSEPEEQDSYSQNGPEDNGGFCPLGGLLPGLLLAAAWTFRVHQRA